LLKAGRATDALQIAEHAIQLDPTLADGHALLAEAATTAGELEKARAAATRAKSLGAQLPRDVEALLSAPR
jgi:Tfp pilus assembly protein PilF